MLTPFPFTVFSLPVQRPSSLGLGGGCGGGAALHSKFVLDGEEKVACLEDVALSTHRLIVAGICRRQLKVI